MKGGLIEEGATIQRPIMHFLQGLGQYFISVSFDGESLLQLLAVVLDLDLLQDDDLQSFFVLAALFLELAEAFLLHLLDKRTCLRIEFLH